MMKRNDHICISNIKKSVFFMGFGEAKGIRDKPDAFFI